MKRAAFFVEGQTELLFIKRLLREIAGKQAIHLVHEKRVKDRYVVVESEQVTGQELFSCLLVDCAADNAVRSAIVDRRQNLIAQGYSLAVGVLDLYPLQRSEFTKLQKGLRYKLPTKGLEIVFCISVMEIESWFLQEGSHFQNIDPRLTKDAITTAIGFNYETDCAEDVPHPANALDLVYRSANKRYKKSRFHVQRTVDALDYATLYYALPSTLPSLLSLTSVVEDFFSI